MVRETFHNVFGLQDDKDILKCESVDSKTAKAYENHIGDGPTIDDLLLDMHGEICSRWNKDVAQMILDICKIEVAKVKENPASDKYLLIQIEAKMVTLRSICRQTKPRMDGDGVFESRTAALERCMKQAVDGHARTRRRSRRETVRPSCMKPSGRCDGYILEICGPA